ncbi:hypothetical protein JY651_39135 [Pyxidicoccus parkwayensis]|uniref:NAD glycohydrolase translocation F5/8 type C domain-containing protein n=1 Tax=Pyxidicoccus parkwayensis TaxID=2813578 RepID=A0ABX7NYK5_9BACT|nr:hypothetical protein [Pyxidicoccus parkwaysis]QSQ21158.1 hypothetical protein JY651_39135 [Pyxidicoccus parkwaysis]
MQGYFDSNARGFSRRVSRTAAAWVGLLTTVAALTLPGRAAAQSYEGKACTAQGRSDLKGLKPGAQLKGGLEEGRTGDFSGWATSTLLPTGKAPACKDCPPEAEDDLNERKMAQHEWTCGYSAQRVSDSKPETAWCEGAKGNGVGEVLLASVEQGSPVRIWAGFGKSDKLHAANARPRKVRVSVLQTRSAEANQVGFSYSGLTVVATGEVELKDVNGYQELKLPAFKADAKAKGTFVALEVLSVYPGAKFEDLCISEVSSADAS